MRIDITCGEHRKVFESPAGIHFFGLTVTCNDNHFSVINPCSDEDSYRHDEEIVFEESLNVVLHYYSSPMIAEVVKEFSEFEGMKFIEMQNKDFSLVVWV